MKTLLLLLLPLLSYAQYPSCRMIDVINTELGDTVCCIYGTISSADQPTEVPDSTNMYYASMSDPDINHLMHDFYGTHYLSTGNLGTYVRTQVCTNAASIVYGSFRLINFCPSETPPPLEVEVVPNPQAYLGRIKIRHNQLTDVDIILRHVDFEVVFSIPPEGKLIQLKRTGRYKVEYGEFFQYGVNIYFD